MRHAVLGVGGIGGLVGAALARGGADVLLLMRPETLAVYGGRLVVQSVVLGDFEIAVTAAASLDRTVEVLWVAVKATHLRQSFALAPPDDVADATVIPLLNGLDHMVALRERYRAVVAGAIRVESERVSPGRIRQTSPFLRIDLCGASAGVVSDVNAAGIDCRVRDDEATLLWDKLAFLAPVALATSALDAPLGDVRSDDRYVRCKQEVVTVARSEGAHVDPHGLAALEAAAPDTTRSSMQKDIAAGREPELDAIAGPIVSGARRHGIDVPATEELVQLVAARLRRAAT